MDNNSAVTTPLSGSELIPGAKTKFLQLFDGEAQKLAQKSLDFYDGKQEKYIAESLKKIRRNAMESGMTARHRNITKMIIDKSGLLFNGKPPTLSVSIENPEISEATETELPDEEQTNVLNTYFESGNWIEFFTNFDAVVRLLKTALVMVYWVPTKNSLKFIALDQHNSACHYDENSGEMNTLIYKTGQEIDSQGNVYDTFRVFTIDLIQDIKVDSKGEETITAIEVNPYKAIPASEFHDTNIPREGFWNNLPQDLLEINEIYNIHISDSEYSAGWNKLRTAVTNATIKADDTAVAFDEATLYKGLLPRRVQTGGPAAIGGPGRIIELNTVGGEAPYFEYKGPDADLAPMDDMIKNWVIDFAADWSVNASIAANGSADSGFKLIVQEMPNLELRKKRQRMMEAGLERLFCIVKLVVNTWKPGAFNENAELEVEFHNPELPVDEKNNEMVWTMKINENRASRIDYLMEVKGMNKDEAELKLKEIMEYNGAGSQTAQPGQPTPKADTVNTTIKV